MTETLAVGVDIGGTKIAFVLLNRQGEPVATHQLMTGVSDGPEAVMDRVAQGIQVLLDQVKQPVAGIGIGCPGFLDLSKGVVRHAVNLSWTDVALCDGVRKRLPADLPIWLQKDTNAAAIGELYFGAARGCRDFVLIAIGTGLGVGAVANGQVIIGHNFYATDVGHLALNPKGRLCGCGLRGCTEMYISGVGLLAGMREHRAAYPDSPLALIETPSTTAILQAARDGDPLAQTVIDEAAEWLGVVMVCCGVMFNPGLFVIGGGLGHAAADLLFDRAEKTFRERSLPPLYEKLKIVRSQVTFSAVGAASLVWHETGG